MSIQDLIKQAAEQSPAFRKKWLYWVVQRNKKPDFTWLISNLEDALGASYVREQAQAYIDSQKDN